jgi:hypothetical protein
MLALNVLVPFLVSLAQFALAQALIFRPGQALSARQTTRDWALCGSGIGTCPMGLCCSANGYCGVRPIPPFRLKFIGFRDC